MKVHFAGLENYDFAVILTKIVGIKYTLFTVWPFICDQFGFKKVAFTARPDVGKFLDGASKHVIMDSGLFTLMFGAEAGPRDSEFMERWLYAMVEYVKESEYQGAVVECDVQKVLSPEEAWRLRILLKDLLPDNELINVYHFEDGKAGMDRMIEFSDYIAISVPEVRVKKIPNIADYVMRQAAYIKNKKPDIKIHLLGCTQRDIMRKCSFCESSDSTSWQQVNRFGVAAMLTPGNKEKRISRKYLEETNPFQNEQIVEAFTNNDLEKLLNRNMTYYSNYAFTAYQCKRIYAQFAGSQD